MNNLLFYSEKIGSWLVYSSLKAAILILLIFAVRWVFQNQMSPRWKHALWLLVFVQLLLPWSPGSKFSIENLWASRLTPKLIEANTVPLTAPITSSVKMNSETKGHQIENQPKTASYSLIEWLNISLFSIWISVAFAMTGIILYMNHRATGMLRQRRLVTESVFLDILEDCKGKLNIHFPVGLVSVPGGESPMIVGLIRPIMVIPERILREFSHKEIRHIMLHELSHIKRWDIGLNWLTAGLQVVYWFNPFVWIAFSAMRSDREQACDMMVINCMGYQEKVPYGKTVIRLIEGFNQSRFLPETVGIMEGKEQMKKRINMIGQFGRKFKYSGLLCLTAMVILGAATLTGADKKTDKNNVEIAKNEKLLKKKLDSIIIEHVEFEDVSLAKVLETLNQIAKESDPKKEGVKIVLQLDKKDKESPHSRTITMMLDDLSIEEVIRYICTAADLKYKIDNNVVVIKSEEKDVVSFRKQAEKALANDGDIYEVCSEWAKADPKGVANWVRAIEVVDHKKLDAFLGIARGLAGKDPKASAAWVMGLPEGENKKEFIEIGRLWAKLGNRKEVINWFLNLPEGNEREYALVGYAFGCSLSNNYDAKTVAQWADKHLPKDREKFPKNGPKVRIMMNLIPDWAKNDKKSALKFLNKIQLDKKWKKYIEKDINSKR